MDDPALDAELHRAALVSLARLNQFSGSARILWPPIKRLASLTTGRALKILDVATGAGDVPARLWNRARRAGIALEIEACDISDRSVQFARQRAESLAAPIRFFRLDALQDELPGGFDCVTCSLFLHHLDETRAVALLEKMARAGRTVVVNDLLRSRLSLAAIHVAVRLLTRSPVVRTDGPLSIHAAYTLQEASELAERAGLHGAQIARRHPCRFLLTWSRA